MAMIPTNKMTPDTLDDVRGMARESRDYIDHVYLHWTAGHYGQAYDDYHICIDENGEIYIMCDDLRETLAHTYMRNRYAVGVSLLCACDAEARNGYNAWLGYEPPTTKQIEVLAQVVAVLAEEFSLPLDCDDYVMTHCEAAEKDDYGPSTTCERWDLWYIPDEYGSGGELVPGGDLIRGKAAYYQRVWEHDETGD